MALSAAEKQRRYRRRKAVEKASNGFTVTKFRQECIENGFDDFYAEVESVAIEVANEGGDGALMLERLAFLLHGLPTLHRSLQELDVYAMSTVY
jgi:hypothetical protein